LPECSEGEPPDIPVLIVTTVKDQPRRFLVIQPDRYCAWRLLAGRTQPEIEDRTLLSTLLANGDPYTVPRGGSLTTTAANDSSARPDLFQQLWRRTLFPRVT
jgi:hypothetical protein